MSLYAVQYTYSDDAALLDEHRPAHREFLGELAGDGTLLLSGPYADPGFSGALLVFRADDAEELRTLLREDPFQQQGLVQEVQLREWSVVLGAAREALTG